MSLNIPNPLFRRLKARAALDGSTVRDFVLSVIERSLSAAPLAARGVPPPALPSVSLGAPVALPPSAWTTAGLAAWLDAQRGLPALLAST